MLSSQNLTNLTGRTMNTERDALIALLNATGATHGQFDVKAIEKARTEAFATLAQKQEIPEEMPKLGGGVYVHEKLGELYDRLQVHQYAVGNCEALTKILRNADSSSADQEICAYVSAERELLAELNDFLLYLNQSGVLTGEDRLRKHLVKLMEDAHNSCEAILAESQEEPVAFQRFLNKWIDTPSEDVPHYEGKGQPIRELYPHAQSSAVAGWRADSKRLEWMVDNDVLIYKNDGMYMAGQPNRPGTLNGTISATFRDAIDSARPTKLQAQCDAFNARCPIGGVVYVKLDGKDALFQTITTSEAQILSGHTAVVWLKDVRGCYALDRVQPL